MTRIRTLVVLLTMLIVVACGGDVTTEEYVQRATDAIDKSEYKAAGIELKNALRQDPNSANARWLLGVVSLRTNDMLSASKELVQARDLGWPPDDIQPALAQALLAQGEFEAVGKLDTTGLTPDAQASLFGLQAQAALALGDNWEAEALIDKALVLKPESVEVLIAKARLLESAGDSDGALKVVDQIIALEPKNGAAWSLKGDILTSQQKYKAAVNAFGKAIRMQRDNAADLFKRALLRMQLGDFEAAEKDARLLIKKRSKHPGSNYVQGLLHFQNGNYPEAIASLSITEPAFKQYPLSMFFLASANYKEGNMDLAITQAERFHSVSPESVQGRKLLAAIRLQKGEFASVPALLQPVLDSYPDDVDALNLASNALLQQGKTNEAIELLTRVAVLQPDSPEAKVRLGAGMLMGGQGDAAVQPIQTALDMDPNQPMADILLVLNHLQKQDFDAAIAAAESYQARNADSTTPYNLLGRVYQEAGKPEQARKAFLGSLALDEADPGANFYLAKMADEDKDFAAARGYYNTILKAQPDSVRVLVELASLDARQGKEQIMVDRLEQAMSVGPTSLEPRILLARYYLAKSQPAKVAPLFTSLGAQQQRTPSVLELMALAQLAMKDGNAAQFSLEQLLKATSDSAKIRHLMALAAAEEGDAERTVEQLRLALGLDETYLPARIALARILFSTNEEAEFEKQLEALVELAPENAEVLLLQAAAAQRSGDISVALDFAKQALDVAPSGNALMAVASYQAAGGDRAGALQRYASWLESRPEDVPVRMMYASTLMSDKQETQASTQYAIILQTDPGSVPALNNQAWLLREKDSPQALKYAREAAAIAPESAPVLDTLAVVEYINEEYEQAQRNVLRALKVDPDNPSMRYHSAMIAAALDDKAGARATLKKLLAANSDFPEITEAKALLAKLQE